MGMAMATSMTRRLLVRDERRRLPRLGWCLAVASGCQWGAVHAQAEGTGLSGPPMETGDQGGSARRSAPMAWRIDSSVMVSDNLGARTNAEGKDAGLLLRVAPGVRYAHKGAAAQWLVDYSLQGQRFVRTPQQGKPFQNSLRASGGVNLLGSALTLDGQASVAQRTRSAFDVQRTLGETGLGETSEVATLSVGPTFRMRLGDAWRSTLKHSASITRARGTSIGDATGQSTQLSLEPAMRALLSWGAVLSHQSSKPTDSRATDTSEARLNLTWRPDVDWSVITHAGRERTNLQSSEHVTGSTYGVNFGWSPTARTRAQLSGEHRSIGDFHTLSLDHRFSRAAIRFSDTRTVNQAGAVGNAAGTTNYDLYFAQLASQAPDPIDRDALVRQRLAELGLSPDALVANGFLSSQASVSRSRVLGLTYQQVRALWTLNLTKTRTTRLFGGGLGSEDLANSSFVNSTSAQAGMTYRVTPASAVRLQASWQRNEGDNAALQRNALKSLVLGWQFRLGPQVQVAAGLRHSEFDSPTRPFTENAFLVNVEQRF